MLFPLRPVLLDAFDSEPKFDTDCALLDLGINCSLRESLRGYQRHLPRNTNSSRHLNSTL